jgi:hypothetical protein
LRDGGFLSHCSGMTTCKNCGGHFTDAEMRVRKPPIHAWQLTPVGQRFLAENEAKGDLRPCPTCGCKTLR